MKVRIVGVVQVQLPNGQDAVALLFDNMRWMLDYSDFEHMRTEIGTTVDFPDVDEIPALLN
jgi:hypothetical protein